MAAPPFEVPPMETYRQCRNSSGQTCNPYPILRHRPLCPKRPIPHPIFIHNMRFEPLTKNVGIWNSIFSFVLKITCHFAKAGQVIQFLNLAKVCQKNERGKSKKLQVGKTKGTTTDCKGFSRSKGDVGKKCKLV